jgi:hypothetical protein
MAKNNEKMTALELALKIRNENNYTDDRTNPFVVSLIGPPPIRTINSNPPEKFISNKTRRPFSAFLMWKDGKVSFDFPPREPRKPKVKKTAKSRASAET